MLQLSVVNIFGLKNIGKNLGAITTMGAASGVAGIFIVAKMQEEPGYDQKAFYLCTFLILVACLCFARTRFRQNSHAHSQSFNPC